MKKRTSRLISVLLVLLLTMAMAIQASAMKIFIDTPQDERITLELESGDSIDNVKQKLQEITLIEFEDQMLIFNGNKLDNGRTLADYNIQKESALQLLRGKTNDGTSGTDITVNGKFQASAAAAEVISVDIVWDEMSFTYTAPSKGDWNAAEHKYENPTAGGWTWSNATETKTAPVITVTNHSNTGIKAGFAFNGTVEGVNGSFTKDALILNTAENTPKDNAPKGETAFSVSGTAIDADKAIGTITVTVNAVTTVSTAEELKATADKTGFFALVGNIDMGGSALTISSTDYVLDLNGFTISGSQDRESVILASPNSNVTVKNGTVNNTCSEYGWAVHEKNANLVLENCELKSYSSGLFSESGTAKLKDCKIKTIIEGHYNITNYNGCALTISGNITINGGAGLSDQLGAKTTALAGTYNFNPTSYVDATLYDITENTETGTWTVTAK